MVKIRVNLSLKEYTNNTDIEINIDQQVPLTEILDKLGIPEEQVGMVIKTVNGHLKVAMYQIMTQ